MSDLSELDNASFIKGVNRNTLILLGQVVVVCSVFFTLEGDVKANTKDLTRIDLEQKRTREAVYAISHIERDVRDIKQDLKNLTKLVDQLAAKRGINSELNE